MFAERLSPYCHQPLISFIGSNIQHFIGKNHIPLQNQKAATAYLKSKQLLPFGFAQLCW